MSLKSKVPANDHDAEHAIPVPASETNGSIMLALAPGEPLVLGFEPSNATYSRSGNDLVFALEGGGDVVVNNFFDESEDSLPSFALPDGTVVAAADFFKDSDLAMTTEAGPQAGVNSNGAGDYVDDPGALIDGLDRLGSLGTHFWGRSSETREEHIGMSRRAGGQLPPRAENETSFPPIRIVPENRPGNSGGPEKPGTPIYSVGKDNVHLVVNEGYLPNGSLVPKGEQGGSLAERPSFVITSEDGVAAVTIDGSTYPVSNGVLEGFPVEGIPGPGGLITNPAITDLGDGDYRLSFDYTVDTPHTHTEEGRDPAPAGPPLVITVTNDSGTVSGETHLTVEIIDDAPIAVDDTMDKVTEGGSGFVNVLDNDSWGADDPGEDGRVVISATISDPEDPEHPITITIGEPLVIEGFGEVTLTKDGDLTFTATVVDGKEIIPDRTVTYTIKDADGDMDSA
ncbi:Ig-like domain-containing protein, partial [Desulfovibrio sp. OttesenSCG-928-M16]|nr:Ig-like domain-containing protein [Desulfovibrio sp. OttesenSCG-928-M16]